MNQPNKTELLKESNALMKKLLEIETMEELSEKDRQLFEKLYAIIQNHKNIRNYIDMKKVITQINYNKLSLPKWVHEYYYKENKKKLKK